jgi:hypothetical protein
MGQRANSGRNATLDEKKERAAGRQKEIREQITGRDRGPAKPAAGAGNTANKKRSR